MSRNSAERGKGATVFTVEVWILSARHLKRQSTWNWWSLVERELNVPEINTKAEMSRDERESTPHERHNAETALQQNAERMPDSANDQEALRAERDALVDRLTRLQADFENTRRRLEREQQQYKEFAVAEALKALLPILDSFDWAFQASVNNLEEFRGGVDLIRKQLHETLNKLGLQSVPAKGLNFDPQMHEAIEVVDTPAAPDNHVVEELQRGYKFRDRLLRPAMVLVSRNPQPQR